MKKQGRGTKLTVTPSPAQLDGTSGLGGRDTLKRRRPSASIHSVFSTDSAFSKPPKKRVEQDAAFPSNREPEVSLEDSGQGRVEYKNSGTGSRGASEDDWFDLSTSPSDINTGSYTGVESPDTLLSAPDSAHKASFDDFSTSPTVNHTPEIPSQTGDVAIAPLYSAQPGGLNVLGPQRPSPPIPFNLQEGKHVVLDTPQIAGLALPMAQTELSTISSVFQGDNSTVSKDSVGPPIQPAIGPPDIRVVVPIPQSPPRAVSPPTPTREIRAIHHNQPVETFSAQDIADIKHAAECLSMFCCNREAFELYTTILKGQLADDTCRDNNFWYLVIQCAHTANIPEHVVVIQNIIRTELARFQDCPPRCPPFGSHATTGLLLHMLLAFTFSRTGDAENVALHIAEAHVHLDWVRVSGIFEYLPPDDRALDLALYRNILRLERSESYDLTSPVPFEFTPFGFRLENKMPFEDCILFQSPGPFELQTNGRMGNPCVRSCILWCERALLLLHSIPVPPEIINLCTDKPGMAWVEANALFITLWEHWMTYNSPNQSTWMTATQERMGISATELLLLVCRAIHGSYYPWNMTAKFDGDLIRRLRKKTEDLVQLPDLKVARKFLKQYISRNTVTMWPSWRCAVQQLEKARMMKCFESVLLVRFPRLSITRDLISSVLIPRKRAGKYSKLVVLREEDDELPVPVFDKAQQLSPTLASSLSSVDLSAFRKTGVSAMRRVSKLARGSLSTSSGFKMSIAGYSDISTSFGSMSISGESASRRRVSSQVVSMAASGSDRILGQSGEEREIDSDRMSVATRI